HKVSSKQWAAVIVVIGLGIVLQIPGHEEDVGGAAEHHRHPAAERPDSRGDAPRQPEPAGPYRTVALEVKGMT
ncbi:MAG: hypothetical protein ACRELT_00625, partial [Longimicrobiales bacterium]